MCGRNEEVIPGSHSKQGSCGSPVFDPLGRGSHTTSVVVEERRDSGFSPSNVGTKERMGPVRSHDGPTPSLVKGWEPVRAPSAPRGRNRLGEKLASTMLERLATACGTGLVPQTF